MLAFVFGNESAVVKISFGIGIEIRLSILQVDVILHDAVVEVFHYRVVGLVTAIISLESDEVRTVPCYVHILQFLYFVICPGIFSSLFCAMRQVGRKRRSTNRYFI